MTYQEQIRRDKLRKRASMAYGRMVNSRNTAGNKKNVNKWLDYNRQLDNLTNKANQRGE